MNQTNDNADLQNAGKMLSLVIEKTYESLSPEDKKGVDNACKNFKDTFLARHWERTLESTGKNPILSPRLGMPGIRELLVKVELWQRVKNEKPE